MTKIRGKMSDREKQGDNVHDAAKKNILAEFQALFFAMRSLSSYPWHSFERALQRADSSQIFVELLERTCLHPVCQKKPPSAKYRRRFLTELIKRHEATASEPLDELYDALAVVLASEEQCVCYKSYFLPAGGAITLAENEATISEGTTGMVTWEAALYLAEWALGNPQAFQHRRMLRPPPPPRVVLELGSGMGLAGVAVCRSCHPKRYTFSDCHPGVLRRLRDNVKLNGLEDPGGPRVAVEELDWGAVADERLRDLRPDTVIAADVVYDPDVIDTLVSLLRRLLAIPVLTRPSDIYIASAVRNPDTYAYFRRQCGKVGLRHQVLTEPVARIFPYNRTSAIEMIRLHL
ncbi:FAM86A protein-like [Scleropages formosus]|uniref:FAM86A protein-like n=1 Tax=Scleropages formosus TaxID=113540 RepID=A0A0P7XCZ2_SCLFO|nr:FAM86A protein-like [Scleropages formosus]